jgi:20S proteasome alpha/beta subunit
LEKRYDSNNEKLDAIHTALLTLRESYEYYFNFYKLLILIFLSVGMTEDNVELVICSRDEGFKRLTKEELKEHILNL